MKKNIFFLCLGVLFTFSCSDMSDTYSQFTKDGEIIYIGKADSLKVRGGRERIEISWLLLSDPKVTGYKIFWNNKSDSIIGNIIKTANIDTVRVLINDLPEYLYNFDVYLNDDKGHSSIRSSIVGRTYGEYYQGSILNRTYGAANRINKNDVQMVWGAPSEGLVNVKISYEDNFGKMISKNTKASVSIDTLRNVPIKGTISYASAYLPQPFALDTFYCPVVNVKLPN